MTDRQDMIFLIFLNTVSRGIIANRVRFSPTPQSRDVLVAFLSLFLSLLPSFLNFDDKGWNLPWVYSLDRGWLHGQNAKAEWGSGKCDHFLIQALLNGDIFLKVRTKKWLPVLKVLFWSKLYCTLLHLQPVWKENTVDFSWSSLFTAVSLC